MSPIIFCLTIVFHDAAQIIINAFLKFSSSRHTSDTTPKCSHRTLSLSQKSIPLKRYLAYCNRSFSCFSAFKAINSA